MAIRSNFSDQFLTDALPVLEDLIMQEYEKYPDAVPEVFNMMPLSTWGTQTTSVAGVGAAIVKSEGEGTASSDPTQGFDKTYTALTYALKTGFSKELIDDNKYDMIEKTYRSLGLGMYQTRQVVAFNVLNDGFADTGPDGVSLFNTAHPMILGHTYANRPATEIALSIAGLRDMQVDLRRQVGHENTNIFLIPRKIAVPPELEETAKELISSTDRPDTPNRATNSLTTWNYGLIVNPFLTSTTAWFALADTTQHELRFYDREAPNTLSWPDNDKDILYTKGRCRFVVGYSDFIGTWGTQGT